MNVLLQESLVQKGGGSGGGGGGFQTSVTMVQWPFIVFYSTTGWKYNGIFVHHTAMYVICVRKQHLLKTTRGGWWGGGGGGGGVVVLSPWTVLVHCDHQFLRPNHNLQLPTEEEISKNAGDGPDTPSDSKWPVPDVKPSPGTRTQKKTPGATIWRQRQRG